MLFIYYFVALPSSLVLFCVCLSQISHPKFPLFEVVLYKLCVDDSLRYIEPKLWHKLYLDCLLDCFLIFIDFNDMTEIYSMTNAGYLLLIRIKANDTNFVQIILKQTPS